MNKHRFKKIRMPSHLVAIVSASGVVKHVEAFNHYNYAEAYIANHENKNRILLSYKQNCLAKESANISTKKPTKSFPKTGYFAVLKPGTRFTVFHPDEKTAQLEGSRIAATEKTEVGLFEVTRVFSKQAQKTERGERRRVRVF